MDVMLAVALSGLLELVLIALLFLCGVAVLISFGHPALSDFRSKCPACQTDTLRPVEAGTISHRYRLRLFRCDACGASYHEALDGTLVEMPREA